MNDKFKQYLTEWKWAVSDRARGQWPMEITAIDLDEFQNWQRQLLQTKIDAHKVGHLCEFNKGGTASGRCAAWIVCNGHTLKIVFNAKKQQVKKGVADTSIEKYHSIDTRGQTLQVASAAAALTKAHGFTTDSQVAEFVGIPSARVSARRNVIEGLAGVILGGVPHYFQPAGRVVCPVTGSSVNGWRVVEQEEKSLF
jgi:hypothetical protein